MLRDADVNS